MTGGSKHGRGRYSNPAENLRTYVMVHGGIDRQERLVDVEWLQDVMQAAQAVARLTNHRGGEFEQAVEQLREVVNR